MQSVSQIWNLHLHFQGFGWQPVLVFDTLLLLAWTCSNIVFWIRKIKLPADCYTTDRMYAWLYQPMTYNQSVLEHVDNGKDGSLFLTCIWQFTPASVNLSCTINYCLNSTCKLFRLLQNYNLYADRYTTDRMYAWLYQSVTNQSVLEHVDNGDGLILPNAGNTQLCFICKLRYQPFVVRALLLYMWRVLTKKYLWSLHTQRTTEVSLSKQPHQL